VTCNAFKAGKINFDDLNFSKEYQDKLCYSQSKLANVLFTLKLSNLLKDTGQFFQQHLNFQVKVQKV